MKALHDFLYHRMLTIRLLEERLQQMCDRGEAGDLHFSRGQEAISVGVCAALEKTDHIVTHHRTIAHQIAMGAPLRPLIAEVLGKATGCNGGHAGEMHMTNRDIRHDFSFQLVGTCVAVAAGIAYALKYHYKTREIVAVFFGDAATSNGAFHEGCTIAAIQKVPLLLVCENNHLAGNITPEYYLPTKTVKDRMAAYGIEGLYIDGNDVQHVRSWASMAAHRVRETGRPYLLECDTQRLCKHKQGQGDVRTKEQMAELSKRDPLYLIGEFMGKMGMDVDAAIERRDSINMELDEAFAAVASDPLPELHYA